MRHTKRERGQSLVELAISLVILLYLLSGAAEFGIVFFQYVQLRDAAQEGALYGSMHPDDITEISNRVKHSSDKPIDLATDPLVTIAISIDGVASSSASYSDIDCEGHAITVEVGYTHDIFMPFMPQLLSRENFVLHGKVTDTILSPVDCTGP